MEGGQEGCKMVEGYRRDVRGWRVTGGLGQGGG